MMVFVPQEIFEELAEADEPDLAVVHFLRSELSVPAVVDGDGFTTTRGRLDIRPTSGGDLRIMYHEIH